MLVDDRAVALIVLVDDDAVAGGPRSSFASVRLRSRSAPPQVLAVEFEQVEGAQPASTDPPRSKSNTASPLSSLTIASPSITHVRTGSATDGATSGKTAGKILGLAGDQPHAAGLALGQNAEAVVLDLVNPARPAGGALAGRGRQGSMRLNWRCNSRDADMGERYAPQP